MGSSFAPDANPAPTTRSLINAGLAEAARVSVGDRVGVLTREPKREFTLVGIFGYSGGRDSLGGSNEVFFTTPVAQQLMLGERDVYTHVTAQAVDGTSAEQLRDALASSLGGDYVVKTGAQLAAESSDGLKEGLSFFNKILLGFAGVALLVGTFLILNTFSIIVAQRTRELALLRAIGASRRQVVGSVLVEAIVIGLLASALGLAAGVGIGAALAYAFGQFAGGLTLAGLGVPAIAVYSSFAVGVLVTLLAALLPALRASRVPPIAAMQDVATPDRPLTRITTAGAVVLAAGAALLAAGLSDNAGDQALATILAGVVLAFIGIALLTPLISRPVVSALGAAVRLVGAGQAGPAQLRSQPAPYGDHRGRADGRHRPGHRDHGGPRLGQVEHRRRGGRGPRRRTGDLRRADRPGRADLRRRRCSTPRRRCRRSRSSPESGRSGHWSTARPGG